MREFWNERYARVGYVYGEEPNQYFAEQLANMDAGRILLPAEGEGRNAVFAARSGWEVVAFDISVEGKKKAEQLAKKFEVEIQYQVESIDSVSYPENSFDMIGLIYAHFPSALVETYLQKLSNYLKPGGIMIMEAFSKHHLTFSKANPKAGGPKDIDLLYTIDEIKPIFIDFEIKQLEQIEIDLMEGEFHQGKSSVIRFKGVKSTERSSI